MNYIITEKRRGKQVDSNDVEAILNTYESEIMNNRQMGKAKLARFETIAEIRRQLRELVSNSPCEEKDERKP